MRRRVNLVQSQLLRFIPGCLLLGALLLFPFSAANAQSTNGRLIITVKDSTGAVIGGANISVTNTGTGQQINGTSNESGLFSSPLLPVGLYAVSVEVPGFKKSVTENVKLDVGQEYSVGVVLEAGGAEEVVSVQAGEELIQKTNAEITNTVTEKQVQQLPLNGRSPLDLIQLQAGVNGDLAATNTVINGQRTSSSTVTQDGINIQDLFIKTNSLDFSPNRATVASVSEFSVTTQNPGADVNGASAIRFVTASGQNEFHGSVFEFNRNSAASANDFFNNQIGIEKPQLNRNQFGFNFSGPVRIPGLINGKDKFFFFGYYEGFRLRTGSPFTGTVLLPDARNGIFTYRNNSGVISKLDILAKKNLSIDPMSANILSKVPSANDFTVGDRLNTAGNSFNKSNASNRDTGGFRLDYIASSRHRFEGVYQHAEESVLRPDIDTTFNQNPLVSNTGDTNFFAVAWNYTISPRLHNEFRVGRNVSEPVFSSKEDTSSGAFVIPNLVTNPIVTFLDQGRRTAVTSYIDRATFTAGAHLLNFGGQIDITRVKSFAGFGLLPTINLGISTAAPAGFGLVARDFPGGIDGTQLATANALLSFLSGTITSANQTFNAVSQDSGFVKGAPFTNRLQLEQYSLYVADQWRARPGLTLNLGIRYDYVTPLHEKNDFALLPVRNGSDDGKAIVLDPKGTLDFVDGFFNDADRNNFAPNVALAYEIPKLRGNTVLRLGYSIQYINDESFRAPDNASAGNSGLSSTVSRTALFGFVSRDLQQIFGLIAAPAFKVPRSYTDNLALNPASAAFIVDPKFKTPYYQQYNLGIEREFLKNMVVSVRYVGNRSTNLARGVDFNQLDVRSNGFNDDVLRARNNGFIALRTNGVFDPRFNPNLPGSQQLTVFPMLAAGGLLTNATIRSFIQQGISGDLASIYVTNRLAGSVKFLPNPSTFVADVLGNGGSSDYHSLQIETRRRFSAGLLFQASYVFSKVLTDTPAGLGQTRFDPLLDNAQPSIERSPASFDVRHAFKTNFVYEMPFGPGKRFNSGNKVVQKLIGGFEIASFLQAQSGPPFSILSGRGTLNRGGRSGNNTASSSLTNEDIKKLFGFFVVGDDIFFIDPKAIGKDGRGVAPDGSAPFAGQVFFNPGPGEVGSLQRLQFTGPRAFNMDFSIIKRTYIGERVNAEFRAEFFNVFNHPIFFVGSQNVNSTAFGQVGGLLVGPRVVQFALKINF